MSPQTKPPAFPTVTVHTPDGDVTMPCEPIGDQLAIVASFGMTEDFRAILTGAFDIVIRETGGALATGGCIACARAYGGLLSGLAGIDWTADQTEIQQQIAALPEDKRRELAGGSDLSWGCDAEWCDRTGPGIVTIPVP